MFEKTQKYLVEVKVRRNSIMEKFEPLPEANRNFMKQLFESGKVLYDFSISLDGLVITQKLYFDSKEDYVDASTEFTYISDFVTSGAHLVDIERKNLDFFEGYVDYPEKTS